MLRIFILGALAMFCFGDTRVIEFYEFGETVSINCTMEDVNTNNETYVRYWRVPDYKVEPEGVSMLLANETQELASTYMASDGWTLHVGWIRHTELGEYTCAWQEDGLEREDKIELNFITPSQWSIYKDNVTVGLIVTAGFIALLIVLSLVYYFRWKDPEESDRRIRFTSNGVEQRPDSAYENPAFNRAEPMHVVHRNSSGITESKM